MSPDTLEAVRCALQSAYETGGTIEEQALIEQADHISELVIENAKLKGLIGEALSKGETALVLLDEIVCALHVLDRRSIEVYGKRYTMPLKLREPIEEADKLLNGEKE